MKAQIESTTGADSNDRFPWESRVQGAARRLTKDPDQSVKVEMVKKIGNEITRELVCEQFDFDVQQLAGEYWPQGTKACIPFNTGK